MRLESVVLAAFSALVAACSLGLDESEVRSSSSSTSGASSTGTDMKPCGGCASGMECISGQCVACAPFRMTPSGVGATGRMAVDGSTLFMAGGQGSAPSAWLAHLDTCMGSLTGADEAGPNSPSKAYRGPLAVDADYAFIAALQTSGKPFLAGVPRTSGMPWSLALVGSGTTLGDEIDDLAVGSSGDLWAVGTRAADTAPVPWLVRAKSDGSASCEFSESVGAGARALAFDGASLLAAVIGAGKLVVERRDEATCPIHEPCTCAVSQASKSIALGTSADAYQMLISNGSVFVVGTAVAADMTVSGYVARFDTGTLNHDATFVYHPSSNDVLFGLTVIADKLYAVGARGWDGTSTPTGAQAVVIELSRSFANGSKSDATNEVPNLNAAFGAAASGTDLFLDGLEGKAGVVMKCDAPDDCPATNLK